jgi:hypothetical protein
MTILEFSFVIAAAITAMTFIDLSIFKGGIKQRYLSDWGLQR